MGDSGATIKRVIERLDLLDGKRDGQYTDMPLHRKNTTGACKIAEETRGTLKKGLPKGSFQVNAKLTTSSGRKINIDCKELARRLNVLIDIAEKIPATKYATGKIKISNTTKPTDLAYEDFYGFHIVDHMIASLLVGMSLPQEPFHRMFSYIPFERYNRHVHWYGVKMKEPSFVDANVTNIHEAFDLFKGLGKKYGFDASPFKPQGPRNSSKATTP